MHSFVFYTAGSSPALTAAQSRLAECGFRFSGNPSDSITHLLLPVPSLASAETIRGNLSLSETLSALPSEITVIGGNLNSPLLQNYSTVDLLKDPAYVWENAAITAECTLKVIQNHLADTIRGSQVLILGWGRIGKHLAFLLKSLGAAVTVAARKESDRSMLQSFGFNSVSFDCLSAVLNRFRIIVNTVPSAVLSESQRFLCSDNAVLIELASVNGIAGADVIQARGLPGKYAAEASGTLIANTIMRLLKRS